MIILIRGFTQLFARDFPHNFITNTRVVDLYRQVTPVIKPPELTNCNRPLFHSSSLFIQKYQRDRRLETLLWMVFGNAVSSRALSCFGILIWIIVSTNCSRGHSVFLNLNSLDGLQLFNLALESYHHVLFWEVSETRVRIVWCVLILPWLEIGVFLLS